jgi:hypothetical protein
MSAFTMKTSVHTDTHHALDRSGTQALCRSNLKPLTWATRGDSDEMVERSAIYRQSGDTFTRSCSRTRVNCLGCQRKLAQELVYAVDTANAWQAVLLGMAERNNRPIVSVTLHSVTVTWGMVLAGYMEQVGTLYALTALGMRASGLTPAAPQPEVHDIVSKIDGQQYRAGTVAHVTTSELAPGDMILAEVGGVLDFTRVTEVEKNWIPAHVEWQGVRCNRPRQVLEVHVVGQDAPLVYRLDEQVTKAF